MCNNVVKAVRFGVLYGVRGGSKSFIASLRRKQHDLNKYDFSEIEIKTLIADECKRQGVKNV